MVVFWATFGMSELYVLSIIMALVLSNDELYSVIEKELNNSFLFLTGRLADSCFRDKTRTIGLMDIVSRATIPETVAADLGAGMGVLGLAFLNAGGGFLYSVDSNIHCCEFILRVSGKLGYHDRLEIHNTNENNFNPGQSGASRSIDLVIAELIEAGLINEQLIPAMNNVKKYTSDNARFIPDRAVSFLRILEFMRHPSIKRARLGPTYLSDELVYDEVTFPTTKKSIDTKIRLKATGNGYPNKVVIRTEVFYGEGRLPCWSIAFGYPVVKRLNFGPFLPPVRPSS